MKARPFDISVVTDRQIAIFVGKVDRSGECWLWMGRRKLAGYGRFRVGLVSNGTARQITAHRLAWLLEHPEMKLGPDDCVLHHCDNPPCCNPDHLFIGTKADNIRDMVRKWRVCHGEQRCNAKITDAIAKKIRRSTRNNRVLAEEYGIDRSQVSRIKNGKRWAHVK